MTQSYEFEAYAHELEYEATCNNKLEFPSRLYERVLQVYEKARTLNPTSSQLCYDVGRITLLLAKQRFSSDTHSLKELAKQVLKAQRYFEQSLAEPTSKCYYQLAQSYIFAAELRLEGQDEEGARRNYEDAVEVFEELYEKRLNGETLSIDDKVEILVSYAETLTCLARFTEGVLHYRSLFERAMIQLREAIRLAPQHRSKLLQEWAHVAKSLAEKDATTAMSAVDLTRCIQLLEAAVQFDANNSEAYIDLSDAYMQQAEALRVWWLDQAATLSPITQQEKELLIWELTTQATSVMEKGVKQAPTNVVSLRFLGDVLLRRAQLELFISQPHRPLLLSKAEHFLKKALKNAVESERHTVLALLAQTLYLQGTKRMEAQGYIKQFHLTGGCVEDALLLKALSPAFAQALFDSTSFRSKEVYSK